MAHTFYLALNFFALTALLLGVYNFSQGFQSWRLVPLLLLVASRAFIVLLLSMGGTTDWAVPLAALEVFSTFCVAWALVNSLMQMSWLWRRLTWLGWGLGLVLSLLPLWPAWPVPAALHSLTIAVFAAPFIYMSRRQVSFLHLVTPFVLALGYFFSLLSLNMIFWMIILSGYGLLVGTLHWERTENDRQRQYDAETATLKAINTGQERQRLLEVSEIISAVPGIDQAMIHLARSMAHVTHADQAIILHLDFEQDDRFHLAALYCPERPVELTGRYDRTFALANYPLLQSVLEQQRQRYFSPADNWAGLAGLYALWFEERLGPTLLQPLMVQGQSVGLLLLGNPVTRRAIKDDDQLLCRSLATQMATMVEAHRRYLALESESETAREMTAPAVEKASLAVPALAAAKAGVVAVAEPEASGSPGGTAAGHAPVLSSPVVSVDGGGEGMSGTMNYLAILESVHEGVVVSDVSGRVRLVNKAAEQILGKTRRELMGQPIATIYGDIDSGEPIENLIVAFSRRSAPLPTFKQTAERTIQGQLIPWRNEDKEWLGIVATFRDVTHQVKADEARNNFVTALSHELRAPLTTIKGYSELIMRGALDEYSPGQLHIQQITHSNVDRMVAVLDNAIQILAQHKNKVLPHFEAVDINAVVDGALQEIKSLANLNELNLIKEVSADLPLIMADRKHLFRILENLLENACQFTPPGGQITVRIWLQHQRAGNTVKPEIILMVADSGVGIPSTECKRIFEPFYQLQEQVLEARGMGMGLAVVKELVEMHQGRVWAESEVGVGSVFQVVLPLTQS